MSITFAKHHLTPASRTDDLVHIAGDMGGLHATAVTTPYLSLLARTRTFGRADLDGQSLVLCTDMDVLQGTILPAQPVVNLLPVLDPYLMGYKGRARYLDEHHRDLGFDCSGNSTSTILVSGRVAGVWDTDERDRAVQLLAFEPLERDIREAIEASVWELGRLVFDQDTDICWCAGMVPLAQRTAGSMMSPLKGCPPADVQNW